jgi:hypothetical protein
LVRVTVTTAMGLEVVPVFAARWILKYAPGTT